MKTNKINFKPILILLCIITLAVCLTACDSGVECEYGVIVAKGEQMEYYIDGEAGDGVHPFLVGYYVKVLKCDENGEIILDEEDNKQFGIYRTTEFDEYRKYYCGDVVELKEQFWGKY